MHAVGGDVEARILRIAAGSRVAMTLLVACTAWLVTPYDTSSEILLHDAPDTQPTSSAWPLRRVLLALTNWDGAYFAHIARVGYDYEHIHAFFPLYPLLTRVGSWLLPFCSKPTAIALAGWLISNASVVLAALYLYRLGLLVLRDESTARRAAYLFIIAPSSVFMTAMYSESLMCLLSFAGMYYLEAHKRTKTTTSLLLCAALFGAASATRSNGALLSLYIAWYRLHASPVPTTGWFRFARFWVETACLGLIAVGPQVLYFVEAIRVYCPNRLQALQLSPGVSSTSQISEDRPWCAQIFPNISAIYMFIQREYWNVGLFKYYEWKQLPNFLLALPVVSLSLISLGTYFATRCHKECRKIDGHAATTYYLHWGFLLVNAILVVHIQVTTRLLSACPPFFWSPAVLFASSHARVPATATIVYFITYCVLGAGLFGSFYPWT